MPSFKDRSTRSADVRTHMTSWTSRAIALCCVPLIAAAACASTTDPATTTPTTTTSTTTTTTTTTTLREFTPDPDDATVPTLPELETLTEDRLAMMERLADSGMSEELSACVADNIDWTELMPVILESDGTLENSPEMAVLIADTLTNCEESLRLLIVGEFVDSGMSEELSACVADNIDWTELMPVILESDGTLENSPEMAVLIADTLTNCEESFRLFIVGEFVDSGMSEELSACVADNIDWTRFWLAFLESDGELENSPEGTAVIIEAFNSCEEPFRPFIVDEFVDSGMSEELSACVADNIDWTRFWLAFLESDGELENSPEGTAVIIEALSHCGVEIPS